MAIDDTEMFPANDGFDPEARYEATVEDMPLAGSRGELFDGDAGALSIDQRLCLIALLKNTYISSVDHFTHWKTLVADDVLIRGRLNDMLLDLVIDTEREVAYKIQVREADGVNSVPPLLKAATYTREETALLIFLRSRYTSDRADGHEHVWVERDEMEAFVEQLRPEHATDKVGDARRTQNAIAMLVRAHILQGHQEADALRISPVIEALLPVGQLHALTCWFAEQNARDDADE